MSKKNPVAIGLATAVILALAACGSASGQAVVPPATVKPVAGSSVQQVQLTQHAIARLGITTEPVGARTVVASGRSGIRKVIPYSAVVYDTDGSTWTFVNTGPRTYVRQPIKIRALEGGVAVLDSGPAVGAAVVTVGAPELLGTEYKISGEG